METPGPHVPKSGGRDPPNPSGLMPMCSVTSVSFSTLRLVFEIVYPP